MENWWSDNLLWIQPLLTVGLSALFAWIFGGWQKTRNETSSSEASAAKIISSASATAAEVSSKIVLQLRTRMDEQDVTIGQQNKIIADFNLTVASLNSTITSLNAHVKEQDAIIIEQGETIRQQGVMIERLKRRNQELNKRLAEVSNLPCDDNDHIEDDPINDNSSAIIHLFNFLRRKNSRPTNGKIRLKGGRAIAQKRTCHCPVVQIPTKRKRIP